jgi:hypothetical protein
MEASLAIDCPCPQQGEQPVRPPLVEGAALPARHETVSCLVDTSEGLQRKPRLEEFVRLHHQHQRIHVGREDEGAATPSVPFTTSVPAVT